VIAWLEVAVAVKFFFQLLMLNKVNIQRNPPLYQRESEVSHQAAISFRCA
jgi:hypothetical protein